MSKVSSSRGATPFDAQRLLHAADAGDAGGIKSLLAAGVDVNAASDGGETALMRAASKGRLDVVHLLLDAGANLEARSENGFTALVVAAFFGHVEVVRALLTRGASTDAWTRLDASAEEWAQSSGHAEIIELLRSPDAARVERPKAKGRTTTRLKKADVTKFFHEGGELQPVVPLAEVREAQDPPTELSAPRVVGPQVAEKNEFALVKTEAEAGEVEPEEIEETTLVSARDTRENALALPASHTPARGAARSSRLFAAMAFGLILGVVAGAFAVWLRSKGSAPSRPAAQTVEEARPATTGDGTQAALPPPADLAPGVASAEIEASQIAATISEPEASEPEEAEAAEAETVASPLVKPVAPTRTQPVPAAAPPSRAEVNRESRDKRAPTPRKEVAVDAPERRVARAVSRPPTGVSKPQTSKPSDSSLPVFSPKPGESGNRKVIPWP